MKNLFTKHPHSLGETYFQHMRAACAFGSAMLIGGVACVIHAIFPFLFEKTGSNFLLKMMHNYINRMPKSEERLVVLHELIDKKIANN